MDIDPRHGKISEGFFLGEGGTRLFYRYFDPGAARHTLIILHGHGEHCGRYQKFFSQLRGLDLSVALFDFRGHGRSEGAEVSVHCYDQYLHDVSNFVEFLKERFGIPSPVYLLGHSAGGLMAILWALRNPESVRKLILSAPLLGIRAPRLMFALNNCLDRVFPHFVYQNPIYPPHLTHDRSEILQYRKDPFIKRKISVRLVSEMLSYTAQLEKTERFEVPFPVCGFLAGEERIVDNRKTKLFFGKLKAPELRIETFAGFYHEIFNEVGQNEVFRMLREVLSS